MTASLLALILSAQQAQAPAKAEPSAAELIGACLKHYYDAKTLVGRIHLTQSAENVTISIDTDVAYERPSKMYIRQRRNGANPGQSLAVSDGTIFSYDRPAEVLGPPRFREAVVQPDGRVQTVPEMYAALGRGSLVDRSPVLDIVTANPNVLEDLRGHWSSLHRLGNSTIREKTVNVITGDYSSMVGRGPTGSFEMDLTPEGDIMRYVLKNRYSAMDPKRPAQPIDVTVISNWEVDVKADAPVDQKLFHG